MIIRDEPVVVTGVGATTPVGGTATETWDGVLAQRSGTVLLDQPWAAELPVRIGAPVLSDPLVGLFTVLCALKLPIVTSNPPTAMAYPCRVPFKRFPLVPDHAGTRRLEPLLRPLASLIVTGSRWQVADR